MSYRLLSDERLLKLLKDSDEKALKEIYLRYWKEIYLAAMKKVRTRNIAEELVQNLFISLWNNRRTSKILQLKSYLYTAIRFQVINFIRSDMIREKYTLQSSMYVAREDNSGESILLTHELSQAIDSAIKSLPAKSRDIFRLNRIEHYTVNEIARDMQLSKKTVEYHITRSIKTMRIFLKDFIPLFLTFLSLKLR